VQRGQRNTSLRLYYHFSGLEPLFSPSGGFSIVLTRVSEPDSKSATSQEICLRRESNTDLWICSQKFWPLDHRCGHVCWIFLSHWYNLEMGRSVVSETTYRCSNKSIITLGSIEGKAEDVCYRRSCRWCVRFWVAVIFYLIQRPEFWKVGITTPGNWNCFRHQVRGDDTIFGIYGNKYLKLTLSKMPNGVDVSSPHLRKVKHLFSDRLCYLVTST
jgi:hypothetical protein